MEQVNFEKEFEKIQEGSGETFKPSTGVHKIKILDEPIETEFVDGESKTPQIKLNIEIEGKQKTWYISKGLTLKSLYGQLIALGKHKGKLKDESITLSVTTSKNNKGESVNSYQVIEAVQILPLLQKPREETVQ